MIKYFMVLALALLIVSPVLGDGIYTWTDEKGVKRFSDHPPENVENYEKIEGNTSQSPSNDEVRPGLKKMLDDVKAQNREDDARRTKEAAAQKEAEERAAQAAKEAKNKAERDRLQQQIDDLNNRALSPTYTQGMRENQIKEIQKKIDALEQ